MTIPIHIDIGKQMSVATREIEKSYDILADNLGGQRGERLWRKTVQRVFADMVQEAKALTPQVSGVLARRIIVWPGTQRQRRDDFFRINFGYRATSAGKRPFIYQMLAIEFGTSKITARMPVYTAWEKRQSRIVADITEALAAEAAKITARLNTRLKAVEASSRG